MAFAEVTTRFLPVSASTPFAVHEGDTLVTPLIDGEEYFTAARMAMGRATGAGDAIYLMGWRFDANFRFSLDPSDNVRLGQVLAEKAAAGVDVRIITSAKWQLLHYLETHTERELRDEGSNDFKSALAWFGPDGNIFEGNALRQLKVRGRTPLAARVMFDYRGEVTGIHHQKGLVVIRGDVVTAFLGGIDFLGNRLDTARHDAKLPRPNPTRPDESIAYYWHDGAVIVEGRAAVDVLGVFLRRWEACVQQPARRFTLKDGATILPSLNPSVERTSLRGGRSGTVSAPVRAAYIALNFPERDAAGIKPEDDSTPSGYGKVHTVGVMYQTAIRGARQYIYIEDQYHNSPLTLFPPLGDAIKRGVKVIAVIGGYDDDAQARVEPKVKGGLAVFVSSLGAAAANIRVFHLQDTVVHSKLMIVDDQFFAIGSANFTDRSMSQAVDASKLGTILSNFDRTIGATDSELHVGVVDDRPPPHNTALALRVRLWAEHLRVDQWDAVVRADLTDLSHGLSLFNAAWGTPVRFAHPASRLVEAKP
jgi:phosphatidylserine/phosphatidylglycerophosphate/cardiolipin synthase-like enzyme